MKKESCDHFDAIVAPNMPPGESWCPTCGEVLRERCKHLQAIVTAEAVPGYAWCPDCGNRAVPLIDVFNNLLEAGRQRLTELASIVEAARDSGAA